MRVKVKVKHLVYGMIAIFALLPIIGTIIMPQLTLMEIEEKVNSGNTEEAKKEIVRLLTSKLVGGKKWEIIRKYMIEETNLSQYDILVGPSMTQVNNNGMHMLFSLEEKLPYFIEYLEGAPIDGYIGRTSEIISTYYKRQGKMDKADYFLEKGSKRYPVKHYQQKQLNFKRIDLALELGRFDKAEDIITDLKANGYEQDLAVEAKKIEVQVKSLLATKDYKGAREVLNDKLPLLNKKWEQLQNSDDNKQANIGTYPHESLSELILIQDSLKKDQWKSLSTVKGKIVRSDGQPLKYAGVFLRDESIVNRSPSINDPYYTITNEKGEFVFQQVVPGSYQIHLGLFFEQVDGWTWPTEKNDWIEVQPNKDSTREITFYPLIDIISPANFQEITADHITFKWGSVKNAAYYNLNFQIMFDGGAIGSQFATNIKDTEWDVQIEDLYAKRVGIVSNGGQDLEHVYPESLLAFANTKGEFSWYVEAYDKSGQLITSSNGYRLNEQTMGNIPVFYLKERKMTDADKLLMDRKFEEALTMYKESYETNKKDIHSLRMINRLYAVDKKSEDEELAYMIDLAEKQPTEATLFSVVQYFYDQEDWSEYDKWYKRYEQQVK